jgi:hypothetical protein
MVTAAGVVTGIISRCELVVGGLCSGGFGSPTVLRSIRHRRSASVEIVLNMNFRDSCLFRPDLRS